jgi:pimeloyl-ACP methyl ester carboxylesterase
MDVPAVRYARNGGVTLAYQEWGTGPRNVVVVPPPAHNVELAWERRELRHLFLRFGEFSRTLHFDKRGTGASDRSAGIATLDERVEDLRAVMDTAGVDRATVVGMSDGGATAVLFAVTYPKRVEGLVLLAASPVGRPDRPDPEQSAQWAAWRERWIGGWGTDATITLERVAPNADASYRAWQPRYERQSVSPGALSEMLDALLAVDVRPVASRSTPPEARRSHGI